MQSVCAISATVRALDFPRPVWLFLYFLDWASHTLQGLDGHPGRADESSTVNSGLGKASSPALSALGLRSQAGTGLGSQGDGNLVAELRLNQVLSTSRLWLLLWLPVAKSVGSTRLEGHTLMLKGIRARAAGAL